MKTVSQFVMQHLISQNIVHSVAPVECCQKTKVAGHLSLMLLEFGLTLGCVFSIETRGGIPF